MQQRQDDRDAVVERRRSRYAVIDSSEIWAEAMVRFVTGLGVEHIDDGRAPGQVDAHIHLPGGALAALEITRAGDEKQFKLISTLAQDGWKWPSASPRRWHLSVATLSDYRRLRRTITPTIEACERYRVNSPASLPFEVLMSHPELWWLAYESDSELFGLPPADQSASCIYLTPAGHGGVVPDRWEGLEEAVADLLATRNSAKHVAKLQRRADALERHLFLAVMPEAVPFGIYYELQEPRSVPVHKIQLPDGVTHLWLATGTSTVTRYSSSDGWSSHVVPAESTHLMGE